MEFWQEHGINILAIAIIVCLALVAALTSLKKGKGKRQPKNWKEANHLLDDPNEYIK
jgi:hypothetical protein